MLHFYNFKINSLLFLYGSSFIFFDVHATGLALFYFGNNILRFLATLGLELLIMTRAIRLNGHLSCLHVQIQIVQIVSQCPTRGENGLHGAFGCWPRVAFVLIKFWIAKVLTEWAGKYKEHNTEDDEACDDDSEQGRVAEVRIYKRVEAVIRWV